MICITTPLDAAGRCPNCEPPEERLVEDDDFPGEDAFGFSEPDFLSGPDREIDDGIED